MSLYQGCNPWHVLVLPVTNIFRIFPETYLKILGKAFVGVDNKFGLKFEDDKTSNEFFDSVNNAKHGYRI